YLRLLRLCVDLPTLLSTTCSPVLPSSSLRPSSSTLFPYTTLFRSWARAGEILTWNGSPHHVLAIPASADFFSLLGIPAAQGRTFGPGDLQNGCTVVLAYSFWQKDLGAPAGIVGAPLSLSGKPCTVAGIMPRGFDFYPKQTSL